MRKCSRLWEDVLAECPGDREALAKLGRLNGIAHPIGTGRA